MLLIFNLVKVTVEDRQVQHIFESNVTSAADALGVACHKCLSSVGLFHHVLVDVVDLHLVLPALNLLILNDGILIMWVVYMSLVSAPVSLGLIGFLNLLGLGLGWA